MSTLMTVLTNISFLGLLTISVYRFIISKDKRSFIAQFTVIAIFYLLLYSFFWADEVPTAREGESNDLGFVIILYLFMILGMFAQYTYTRFTKPKAKRPRFDFGLFIAPVLASPIVFIPLLAALQNSVDSLQNLTTAKAMVFLVAFENGFFWKEYFDNRTTSKGSN